MPHCQMLSFLLPLCTLVDVHCARLRVPSDFAEISEAQHREVSHRQSLESEIARLKSEVSNFDTDLESI